MDALLVVVTRQITTRELLADARAVLHAMELPPDVLLVVVVLLKSPTQVVRLALDVLVAQRVMGELLS